MKTIVLLFLLLANVCTAQTYQNRELFPKTLAGGNSCLIIVHNHTGYGLQASLQSGTATAFFPAYSTTEFVLPNGWNGYLFYDATGASTGLRDYLGADCDTSKPWVRHIHAYWQTPETVIYAALPGVNIPDDLELAQMGFTWGLGFTAFLAVAWTIKKKLKIVL